MKRLGLLLACFLLLSAVGCSYAGAGSGSVSERVGVTGTGAVEPVGAVEPAGGAAWAARAAGDGSLIPERVAAASGSLAQIWLLAGGTLAGATDDAFESGFVSRGGAGDGVSGEGGAAGLANGGDGAAGGSASGGAAGGTASIGGNHEPSLEQIIALDIDLILLSADIPGHVKLSEQLGAAGITAEYFSIETFDDYLGALKICTDITGRGDLYEQNGLAVGDEIARFVSKAENEPSPQILLLRASSGKVVARNSSSMAGIMLRDMGCVNIADSESGLLDNLSLELIILQDPDFIFVTFMGDEENAEKALRDTLLSNPAWAELSAVKNGRFVTLPKDLFHQKPNDRWAEAYELLWEVLYKQ